jgi:uncharacterized protein DUF1360
MTDSPHDAHRIIGYLSAMGVFGTGIAASGLLARARGRSLPARYDVADLVLGAVATHKFARLAAKDGVTTPLRAPFTDFEGNAGSAEVDESPKDEPGRHVIGELIICPFCLAPWIATAYVAGLTLAPRAARAWAAVFTMVAGADFLQHAYAHVRTD